MEESNNTPTPTPLLDESPKSSTTKLDPKTITSRYTVIDKLGQGGMGRVYSALDAKLNRTVAIKLLPYDNFNQEQWMRFQLEAKAASKLNHPNIVQILDFGQSETNEPYLVMEYVKGKTLSDYLKEDGVMELAEAVDLISQLCEAMHHAHLKGIVHRDLKPANIIIEEGKSQRGLILDFGIAKFATDNNDVKTLTQTGQIIGSPRCLSPEQARGEKVDHRADIYSMACILFECLTGQPVFAGENALATIEKHLNEKPPKLSDVCDFEIPTNLELAVEKALRKDPLERFQSISQFQKALVQKSEKSEFEIIDKSAPLAETNSESLQPKNQRLSTNPKTPILLASTILLLLGAFYVTSNLNPDETKKRENAVKFKEPSSPNSVSSDTHSMIGLNIPPPDKLNFEKEPEDYIGLKNNGYGGVNSEKTYPGIAKPSLPGNSKREKDQRRIKEMDNILKNVNKTVAIKTGGFKDSEIIVATQENLLEILEGRPDCKKVYLLDSTLNDSILNILEKHPSILALKLKSCVVDVQTLSKTNQLKNLKMLEIDKISVGINELKAIAKNRNIEFLSVKNCQLEDSMLEPLMKLKNLRVLNISGNEKISTKALEPLKNRKNFCIIYNKLNKNLNLVRLKNWGITTEEETPLGSPILDLLKSRSKGAQE